MLLTVLLKRADLTRPYWTSIDTKKAHNLVVMGFLGRSRTYLDLNMVEAVGIEPTSVNPPLTDLHMLGHFIKLTRHGPRGREFGASSISFRP